MVTGIEKFRQWFRGYEDQYAIIGGTACDLLMGEEGITFRATKDIDLVLIVEAITPDFGRRFWQFIKDAGYKHRNKSTGMPQFYRFSHPSTGGYPFMIELFSRTVGAIDLPEDAALTPLPIGEDISSLSAILLDDDYYQLIQSGTTRIDGVNVLDAACLILFKAKAWLDLTEKKAEGKQVDRKDIRKHKNDVFRLSDLLTQDSQVIINPVILKDLQAFLIAMQDEEIDMKRLGMARSKEAVIADLMRIYMAEE